MRVSDFFIRHHAPTSGICFVLMPFEEALTAVYEHGIKPQIESMGMQCKRADEIYSAQSILSDIWGSIQSAELVIADLTGRNPNVMYELGLCHALWKRVILLSQNKDDVPFDLRAWRVIWYDFSFPGAARLKEELGRAVEALRAEKHTESQPIPLPASGLTQAGYPAPEPEWVHGKIESWRPDRRFGFIDSGEETFWFSPDYLFAASMIPTEGARVVFLPLPALTNARHRRASMIFVDGTALRGQVSRVLKGRGCAFATVDGHKGQTHSLFLETGEDPSVVEGATIECTTGQNRGGPTGTDVKVLSDESPGFRPRTSEASP